MRWNKDEDQILKNNFGIITVKKFAHLLPNRNISTIYYRAERLGLHSFQKKKSPYTINLSFFDNPNIINSYWAGFIAADGNLIERKYGSKYIQIVLQERDKCILEQFTKDIESTYPIHTYKCKNKNQVRIGIKIDNNIWDNLNKYWNLTPQKTFTLKPPNITNFEQQIAYIIGLIDGDGSICICNFKNWNKTKIYPRIKFMVCGTYDIINWTANILNTLTTNYNAFKIERTTQTKSLYYIRCDKLRAQELIEKLSQIKIPWRLPRKWDIIKNYDSKKEILI